MVKKRSPAAGDERGPGFAGLRDASRWYAMSVPWLRLQLAKGRLTRYKSGPTSHAKTLVDLRELQQLIQPRG
jgi:hypothetical protein